MSEKNHVETVLSHGSLQSVSSHSSETDRAVYQCGTCKRSYTRVDHLARHVRSHTQSRPYACHICPKRFARIDLLKRHVTAHETDTEEKRRKAIAGDGGGPRVSQACTACASNHLRCSEEKPCTRCVQKRIACQWPGKDSPTDLSAMVPQEPISIKASQAFDSRELQAAFPLVTPEPNWTVTNYMNPLAPMFGDVFTALLPTGVPGATWSSQGITEFGFCADMELNDIDLSFLDSYNAEIPFDFADPLRDPAPLVEPTNALQPTQTLALGSAAYRNSHLKFRPSRDHHKAAENHNLSVQAGPNGQKSPESRIVLPKRTTTEKLSLNTRDSILALILSSCPPENRTKAIASFPSVELLDTLLQFCLTSHISEADSFLHLPTFNPNKKRPELIAAVIAYGAVLTNDPSLTKLGLAIQECIRTAISGLWETDNSSTRYLDTTQAFLVCLEIGLWSGNGRKMEIAESVFQPLLTMMRRGGRFRRAAYRPDTHPPTELDRDVTSTWHQWAEQESFKRTAFRILQHDTHLSMALLVAPIISYAEYQLPLPDGRKVWMASDAHLWRHSYQESLAKAPRKPSVIDYLNDLDSVGRLSSWIDSHVAHQAFLGGAWGLVWEYVQLSSVQRGNSGQWNRLCMATRCEEITKILHNFRSRADVSLPLSSDIQIQLELTLMHLHMSLDDVQIFAGIEGPEEARHVMSQLQDWVQSQSARQAIWHAAQVLRIARAYPRASLCRFPAVAMYHSSIAFWAYGLLLKELRRPISHTVDSQLILLDGLENMDVQRFIQTGQGRPAVTRDNTSNSNLPSQVFLSDPSDTMGTMIEALKLNWGSSVRPILVDNLAQLMSGLQSAIKNLAG